MWNLRRRHSGRAPSGERLYAAEHLLSDVATLIAQWAATFDSAGLVFGHGTDNAWDEATWLVLHVTGLEDDRSSLEQPVDATQSAVIERLAKQRIETRQPLAYLLGEIMFAGHSFLIEPGVIVPRSPLGQMAQQAFQPWLQRQPTRIIDLCCGSGCIGIAAALQFPQSQLLLVDIAEQACALARLNVQRHNLEGRAEVLRSDLFETVPCEDNFDLLLCNPPYVDAPDMTGLPPEFEAEPVLALAAGVEGLDIIAPILEQAARYLTPDGLLVGEVGNSAAALLRRFPALPFIWPELPQGGEGVFVLDARALA